MADLYKWRVYCETESSHQYEWLESSESEPTECPNDPDHTITSGSAAIVEKQLEEAPSDIDGAPMTRVKMFKAGVAVRFHFVSFETSNLGSLYHKDSDGNDFEWCTYKIFNSSDDEITNALYEGTAVRTEVTWEPTSIDYEIIGGAFYQDTAPLTDVYVWAIGVPDVPAEYGGSIPFASSANLKNMGSGLAFNIDGRVPKAMVYDETNHTSKFKFIFKHGAGVQVSGSLRLDIAY